MTTVQVVETSVTVNKTVLFNTTFTQTVILNVLMKMIPGFKPFTLFFFVDNKIWMCNVLEKDESLKCTVFYL